MKDFYKKLYDDCVIHILAAALIIGLIFFTFTKVTYIIYRPAECEYCAKWETKDNDMIGKYHREWEECVDWDYYDCYQSTLHFSLDDVKDSIEYNGKVELYDENKDY